MKVKEDAIPESQDVPRSADAEDALALLEGSLEDALVPAAAPLPPPPAPGPIAAAPSATASSFSKSIGTKTLFGVGIVGSSFSGAGASAVVSAAPTPGAGPPPPATPGSSVPDFLNEVTKALDAQAAEARARALEASPAAPAAGTTNGTPATVPGRQADAQAQTLAPTAKISSWLEQEPEFEEPDDGPTSLTPGIVSISDDVTASAIHLGAESIERRRDLAGGLHPSEHDEPVVLGLPPQSGLAAPRAIPTPFAWSTKIERSAGFHDPVVEAESFQPTPPAGVPTGLPAHGRSGTPMSGSSLAVPTVATGDARRRTFLSSTEHPALHANGSAAYRDSGVQQYAPVTAPAVASSSRRYPPRPSTGEVHLLLKSYIKLGTTTLVALIVATFLGGLVVGFLVGRGRNDSSATGPSASSLHPHGSGPSTPTPVRAPVVTAIPAAVDITPIPPSSSNPAAVGRSADAARPSTVGKANKEKQRGAERVTVGESDSEAGTRTKAKTKTKERDKEKETPDSTTSTTASSGGESLAPAAPSRPPRNTSGAPIVAPLPRPKAPAAAASSSAASRSMTPASAVAVSPKAPSSSSVAARPSAAPPKGPASGAKQAASKNAQSKSGWHDPFAD